MLVLAVLLFLGCGAIGFVDEDNVDKCGEKKYTSSKQICESDVLKEPCGNGYYDPVTQFCSGQDNLIYDKCNGRVYNSLNQICRDNIVLDKCGNDYYNPNSSFEYCYNNIVNEYTYTTIGTQTWMTESLRLKASDAKCYDDKLDNCVIFGVLYNWNTAMNICPSGWRLPNDNEWDALRDFVEDNGECSSCAGKKLKANSELWISGKGTDDFGFNALPGGFHSERASWGGNTPFIGKGEQTAFWSATGDIMGSCGHMRTLNYNKNTLSLINSYNSYKSDMAYVRCIKD